MLKAKKVLQTEEDYGCYLAALEALAAMGPEAQAAVPTLIELLKKQKPGDNPGYNQSVHRDALRALAKIGAAAKAAIPLLIEMLRDFKYTSLADEISAALGGIGPDAIPALLDIVKDKTLKGPGNPRRDAIRALGHMGSAARAAIPALNEALEDEDVVVRLTAREALLKIRR